MAFVFLGHLTVLVSVDPNLDLCCLETCPLWETIFNWVRCFKSGSCTPFVIYYQGTLNDTLIVLDNDGSWVGPCHPLSFIERPDFLHLSTRFPKSNLSISHLVSRHNIPPAQCIGVSWHMPAPLKSHEPPSISSPFSSRQEGNDFVSSFEFRLVTAIWHLYPFAFFKFLPVGQWLTTKWGHLQCKSQLLLYHSLPRQRLNVRNYFLELWWYPIPDKEKEGLSFLQTLQRVPQFPK